MARVALLVAGMATNHPEYLSIATQDKLHQPYRQPLFPAMKLLMKAAMDAGALGGLPVRQRLNRAGPDPGTRDDRRLRDGRSRAPGRRRRHRQGDPAHPAGSASGILVTEYLRKLRNPLDQRYRRSRSSGRWGSQRQCLPRKRRYGSTPAPLCPKSFMSRLHIDQLVRPVFGFAGWSIRDPRCWPGAYQSLSG